MSPRTLRQIVTGPSLLGLCAFATLSGCGGAAPGPDMEALKGRYSERTYIVGHGSGPTEAEAKADARSQVANQISASLKADLQVTTSESSGDTDVKVSRFIQETSDFDRAEMIKVVRKASHCAEGQCTAMAVLSRGDYLDTLAEDYADQRPNFTEAATAAERGGEDITRFTRNFRAAMNAYSPLARIARRAKVVAGGGIDGMEADDRRARSLVAMRASKLGALKITINAGGLANAKVEAALEQRLISAMSQLGLSAASGAKCSEGLSLVLSGAIDCAQGTLGSRCSLPLTARLAECDSGTEIAPLDFRALKLKGAHPKRMDLALAALIDKAGKAQLVDPLKQQLHAVLPLEN